MRRHRLPAQFRWLFALSLILPLLLTPAMPAAADAAALAALPRPAALSSSPHTAQQINLVDQIGGQPQAIYLSGGRAYLVMGPRLFILDIATNPGHVYYLNIYTLLSPLLVDIKSVYVTGGYAYLTSGIYGLLIINVADPAHPALVGQLSLPGQANDVVVQGSYAFVADGTAGVQAVDVSQPAQPALVDTLPPDAGDSAFALVTIGDFLYVADYTRLLVVNKSNPAQLTKSGDPWPLAGATDIAYVPSAAAIYLLSSSPSGLCEFLVTLPGSFTPGRTQPAANGSKLAANSSYIYLLQPGQTGHSVQTVLRSTMAAPSTTAFDGYATDLATDANNYVYKLDYDSGMKIYTLSGSSLIFNGGYLSDLGPGLGLDLYGSSLNVAAGSRGLVTLDISDPAHPFAANEADVTGSASNVETTASYAYLAAGTNGVRAVATGAGSEAGGYTLTGMNVNDLALHTRAVNFSTVTDIFMGTDKGVVAVTFTTPPATFTPLSAITTPKINEIQIPPTRLGATNSYIYIATEADFEILKIIDPVLSPFYIAGRIEPLGPYSPETSTTPILGFDIQNSSLKTYAYLCFGGGMDIVDMDFSDPANVNFNQVGNYPMPCQNVDVIGDRAFVLSTDQVSVLDISNRSDPKRIGFYTLNGIAEDILAYKPANSPYTYIYASDMLYGVWVLRFSEHTYLPVVMRH